MIIKEGGYEFHQTETGHTVMFKRRVIGEIVTHQESNGRHCFRLGVDNRKEPRTYRGKVTAANALKVLDELVREAKSSSLSMEDTILRSWERTPSTV